MPDKILVESLKKPTSVGSYSTTDTSVNLSSAMENAVGYATWNPGGTHEELIKWTGKSGAQITGLLRGLSLTAVTDTEVAGNKKTHDDGETVAVTNVHYIINDKASVSSTETITGTWTFSGVIPKSDTAATATTELMRYDETVRTTDNQTVAGVKTFSSFPVTPSSDPTTSYQVANKNYVDTRSATRTSVTTVYFGEAATAGQAVSAEPLNNTDGGSAADFGRDAASNGVYQAQSFIAGSSASSFSMTVSLMKQGSPADNVYVAIETDSAGSPSGVQVTNGQSADVAGGTITGAFSDIAFTWASDPTLTAGTKYWLVLYRDGANSDADYYQVEYASNNAFRSGQAKKYTTSWTTNTGNDDDLVFAISGIEPTAVLSIDQSYNSNRGELDFLGIAKENAAIGELKEVTTLGAATTGLSGLTPGSNYYISSTAGAVTVTPSTFYRIIGRAYKTDAMMLDTRTNTDVASPVGSMLQWLTNTAPTGWLLCYGQAISRATYYRLFSVISTAFGVGDGSTTFNLPDLRGRLPLGQDDMGGSSANRVTSVQADSIGGVDGAESVTLTAAESGLPAHTHTITLAGGGAEINRPAISDSIAGTAYETSSTGGTAASSAHNNMPPYIVVNYIIKY